MTVPAFLASLKRPVVLMGDFNAVDDRANNIRNAGTNPSAPIDHALVAMVSGLEMVDVWKALGPRDAGHTYFHQGGSARIDRIYFSRSLWHDLASLTPTPLMWPTMQRSTLRALFSRYLSRPVHPSQPFGS